MYTPNPVKIERENISFNVYTKRILNEADTRANFDYTKRLFDMYVAINKTTDCFIYKTLLKSVLPYPIEREKLIKTQGAAIVMIRLLLLHSLLLHKWSIFYERKS